MRVGRALESILRRADPQRRFRTASGERDHFLASSVHLLAIRLEEAIRDLERLARSPSGCAQPLLECRDPRIGQSGLGEEGADAPDPAGCLLRSYHRREGYRARARAGQQVPPSHSMTSSARARRGCGTVRPSAFAVLRLSTISYLFGAWTGRSAGFSPFRMRWTYPTACRN